MTSFLLNLVKIITLCLLPFLAVQADVEVDCEITDFSIYGDSAEQHRMFSVPISFPDNIVVESTFMAPVDPSHEYFYKLTFVNETSEADFTVRFVRPTNNYYSNGENSLLPMSMRGNLFAPTTSILHINVSSVILLPMGSSRTCDYNYQVTLRASEINVLGDPQFHGLRGQSYQVHGIDGAIYNLISTRDYAVNSRFEFLTGPRFCPNMPSTGKKTKACWSHDGSYLANFAIVTSTGEKFAAMSGPGEHGFAHVIFNHRNLQVGDSLNFTQGSIFYNTTHEITINVGLFYIEVENVDGFVNLRRVHVDRSRWMELEENDGAHGLLGQTWENKRYKGQKIQEIEGDVDDYVIGDDDLFGSDFIYNRLQVATK